MRRRDLLAGAGLLGISSIAGCLGTVGLDEHVATPTSVDGDVLEETGYERTTVEEIGIEREVPVLGEEISVKNYAVEHEKTVELEVAGRELIRQRAAVFVVLTTPQIGVPGQEFNPVEEMSAEELVDLVQDNYDDISDVEHVEDDEVEILGQTTPRSLFAADAQFNGIDFEVDVHVSEAVETDDDLLVSIGVYPQLVRSEEEENVLSLMGAVTEDGEVEPTDGDADEDDEQDGDDGENNAEAEDTEEEDEEEDDGIGL